MSTQNPFLDFVQRMKLPDFSSFDWNQSIETLRRKFYSASRAVEADVPQMADERMLTVRGASGPLKARFYVPQGAGIGPAPGIVFFHGGGFVMGDLDTHDMICRRLADAARCRLISVSYRKAPEHSFPAAHDDALAAWDWILENADELGLDPSRLAVSGDSAGANLATFIAQEMVHANDRAPAFQLLLYPLLQFVDIRSHKLSFKEGGFFISANLYEYFRDSYVPNEADRMDPRASPLFAQDDRIRGIAPAHMVLCGWDPLKYEANAYADKMASFGVKVTIREHADMVHGFMNMTAFSETVRDAIRDAGTVTGKALGALDVTD